MPKQIKTTPKEKIGASTGLEQPKGTLPASDTITLPKDQLERLIQQMDEMKKTNAMLLEVSDKSRLAHYYSKNSKDLPKTIRLRTIGGKLVVGWRSIMNVVRQNPLTGIWNEDQRTEVIFEDGTRQEMTMVDFEAQKVMIDTTKIGEVRNEETNQLALKLRRHDNNQEVVIAVEFVN